jgi:hypothetical protein
MDEQTKTLEAALAKLKNKDGKIYFLTQDTEGRAAASVSTNYQYVKHLVDAGFNASILYEKKTAKGVGEWLGSEFTDLPHGNIESGELKVGPADIVMIPELYGHVLEQIVQMPCQKIILCQAYDYILETLKPGFSWPNYGVTRCMTTTKAQKEHIKTICPTVETTVVPISIPKYFKPAVKPKKPLIAIHTRDQRDTLKIIKTFYLQNPQFKWITFKDMRGMSRVDFAEALGESCVSIWVDRISGLGTFPIESMMCNTPVIGSLPILKPDWLTNDNGIWTFDESKIVEVLGNFLKNWLEDSVPVALYEKMAETTEQFSEEKERDGIVNYFTELHKTLTEDMENSINKLSPMGVNS